MTVGGSAGPHVDVVPDEVAKVGHAIGQAAEQLRKALAATGHDVDTLLTSGWSGDAARAFSHGWADCEHGGREILHALTTLSGKLHGAAERYETSDHDAGSVDLRIV
ncbi:WXG100 family type VII secretion target [Gordonia sp. OPL2]|uniref:WXG100 family type VII secretion target n=1 Tax=Gordonia sp. OPL2 TaxID=2486274 RepID=UPI0016563F8E|nr:WXG100 family type VII secretion target [Gordonia sp. OPL2]